MERGMTALQEAAMRTRMPVKAPVVPVVEMKPAPAGKTETRQQKWKRLNPGKVRAAQAALMRKRRAKS